MIKVFLSRPSVVRDDVRNHLVKFNELLSQFGMEAHTIGQNVESLASPFDEVVALMKTCDCCIILGFRQLVITQGYVSGRKIEHELVLPTEWNHIEGTIAVMLGLPTLMMREKGVADRGLFAHGAANVFIHEFHTLGPQWVARSASKLKALAQRVRV